MKDKAILKSDKTGSPPGTLIYIGEERLQKVSVNRFLYSEEFLKEELDLDPKSLI